jgi:hypothetical protein
VLVGDSAAILYTDHRESRDHDHVVADLAGVLDRPAQLVRQLSKPAPADASVIEQLSSYRRLRRRWGDWGTVTQVLGEVASRMVSQ